MEYDNSPRNRPLDRHLVAKEQTINTTTKITLIHAKRSYINSSIWQLTEMAMRRVPTPKRLARSNSPRNPANEGTADAARERFGSASHRISLYALRRAFFRPPNWTSTRPFQGNSGRQRFICRQALVGAHGVLLADREHHHGWR